MTTHTDHTDDAPAQEWAVLYPDGTYRPVGTRADAVSEADRLDDATGARDPDGDGSRSHLVILTSLAADRFALRPDHYANGYAAGSAAGSWVIDGNTAPATARAILDGIADGDPEILDMAPAPLSGEWAGESMPELLGPDWDDDAAMEAYETGYSAGYWDTVETAARAVLEDSDA